MRRLESGRSVIGVLVGMAVLIGVSAVFFMGGIPGLDKTEARKDGQGETVVGRAMLRAEDAVCDTNLKQIRQAIQIQTDPVEETRPQNLGEMGLGEKIITCPISNQPYQYDPTTGTVKCTHPGHEKY